MKWASAVIFLSLLEASGSGLLAASVTKHLNLQMHCLHNVGAHTHKKSCINTQSAPWVHVGCHGCSISGGCSPERGRVLWGRTEPTAGVCRQAVEGRTGPPGRKFLAAPWEHDNTPPQAAGSMGMTRSPRLLSTPPEKKIEVVFSDARSAHEISVIWYQIYVV